MGKKNKRKILKGIFLLIGILMLIVFVLIAIQFKFFSKKKIISFNIKDPCSLMMDKIFHQIKNDGNCEVMCINECRLREREFLKSEFTKEINACNKCKCYCK